MSRGSRAHRGDWTPALLFWGATLVLGGLVSWAHLGEGQDTALLRAIALRSGTSPGWQIAAAQWTSWAGDAAQRSAFFIGCALWLLWKKRPRASLIMLIIPALAGASSSILKQIFARPRPDLVPHLDAISNLSFPSGHATNAVTILVLAALLLPTRQRGGWLSLAVLLAGLISTSRILLGVHWPSDVLGGILWGLGFALAGTTLAQRWPDARR